jgi:hypothetical protein
MSGILTTLDSWLPAKAAIGVFLWPGLIWLAHRVICVIELRMILRSLPQDDRVTAAVAYVTAYRSQTPFPTASSPGRERAPPSA